MSVIAAAQLIWHVPSIYVLLFDLYFDGGKYVSMRLLWYEKSDFFLWNEGQTLALDTQTSDNTFKLIAKGQQEHADEVIMMPT